MMTDNGSMTQEPAAIGSPEKIKVLAYHRVVKDDVLSPSARRFATNVEVFRSHMRILERNGFTAITLRDYDLFLAGELNLPRRPVIITFDDGYLDTYEVAFPVLREYGMKAVVFVVADPKMRVNSWERHASDKPAPLLSPAQVLELHQAGMEIGSHSLTHRRLTEIPRDEAWDEISRSRVLLEILLNAPVKSFCYPYGLVNSEVRDLVRDAGYSVGCGVYTGPPRFGADRFDIRRIEPSCSEWTLLFRSQVLLPYEKLDWLRYQTKKLLVGHGDGRRPGTNGAGNGA
jgi:peptidoglycan/xylan/chitin deacetylase (PgdA/CDA1 family)